MNLNFIELSTVLQIIIILNSSDGNNIKLEATKRLAKFCFRFVILNFRKPRS